MDNKTDILISGYIQIINYPDTRIFVSIPTEYLLYLAYLSTATLYNSVCDKTLCAGQIVTGGVKWLRESNLDFDWPATASALHLLT